MTTKIYTRMKMAAAGLLATLQVAVGVLLPFSNIKAAVTAVSPTVDAQTGFPLWYQDSAGLQLQSCLGGATGTADPNCVLPLPGEEPNYDPTQPVSFPNNFPSEFFYWIAEAEIAATGPALNENARLRLALEGAFNSADGSPAAGTQITFLRVNMQQMSNLEPNSTYTITHPYGTFDIVTDATGATIPQGIAGGGAAFRAQDGCTDIPGTPCDFSILLPAPTTAIGPLLQATAGAPAGYIGDGITPTPVNGGINGNIFQIDGPNIGGTGVNTIQTNLFTVAGKIFTPAIPTVTIDTLNAATSTPTLTGVVSDPAATVTVTVNGETINATVDPATGIWSAVVTIPLPDGTYDVAAAATNAGGTGNDATTNELTVTAAVVPVLTTINVTPINPALNVGDAQQFTAETLDQNGQPIVAAVTWTSSDPAVGTIDLNTGAFTAVAAGTTTVTATSDAVTGTSSVTVGAVVVPVLTTINVTPINPALNVGDAQQFTAETLDQNGQPIVAAVTWTSSDPAVGTIDLNTGAFTAVAAGTTTVTATSDAVTGTSSVTVNATTPPPVNPANGTVTNPKIIKLSGTSVDIKWSVSTPGKTKLYLGTSKNQITDAALSKAKKSAKTLQLNNSTANHIVSLRGLAKNKTYYFRIATVNPDGSETLSPMHSFKTGSTTTPAGSVGGGPVVTIPISSLLGQGTVVNPVLANLTRSGIDIVWTVSTPGKTKMYLGTSKAHITDAALSKSKKVAKTLQLNNSTTQHVVSLRTLKKNKRYYFRIATVNPDGSETLSPMHAFTTKK